MLDRALFILLTFLLNLLSINAFANSDVGFETLAQHASPVAWRASYEIIPIIGDDMGVAGLHYDIQPFESEPSYYMGLGGYGGLTGEEGGFFTMGATFGKYFRLSQRLNADLGLHFGGGGGSRFTFPGGGMIVRPHAALELNQGSISWRFGVAQTRFPNSTNPDHSDTHLFFGIRKHSFDWRLGDGGGTSYAGDHTSFRVSAAGLYYLTDDSQPLNRDGSFTGNGKNKDIPLLGVKVERFFSSNTFSGLEFYGAGGGGADGYAAILLSLGHIMPLGQYLEWENKATTGMAGDGRLDTGGGVVAQLSSGFNLALSKHWYLRGAVGRLIAIQGELAANVIDVGIGWRAEMPIATVGARGLFNGDRYQVVPWVSSMTHKTYFPKASTRNKVGNPYDEQLHLVGLALSRTINDWFSLSSSTHWAYDGNIGSYAEGMIGMALHPSLDKQKPWRLKLGYEVGVCGGGVMDVDGGVIHQANIGLQYQLSDVVSADINWGRMESKERTFQADVALLQLNWHHSSLFLR